MTKKTIYRTAIVSRYYEVLYISDIFFSNKETAIKEVKKMACKKEEKIATHRWVDVCTTVTNHTRWWVFEKIKNDSNQRYFGIIAETLVVE